MTGKTEEADIRHHSEILWQEFPGHFGGALSKLLAHPEVNGAERLDFRISTYQPMAHVAPHTHKIQEQIYYILEGKGLMEVGDDRTVVTPGTTIFIPPGISHAIYNSGTQDLTFLVITTPPNDD